VAVVRYTFTHKQYRTTQNKQYTEQHKNKQYTEQHKYGRVRAVPRLSLDNDVKMLEGKKQSVSNHIHTITHCVTAVKSKYFRTSGNHHTDKRKTYFSFNALLYILSCYLKQFQNVKRVAII
jgi:hypothetical protein